MVSKTDHNDPTPNKKIFLKSLNRIKEYDYSIIYSFLFLQIFGRDSQLKCHHIGLVQHNLFKF